MREQLTTSVILSQTNIRYFLDMREQLTTSVILSQQEDAVYQPRVYQGSHYLSVYHLVRHHSHRSTDDWLQRTAMAVFLFRCLHVSGYFGESSSLSGTHLNPDQRLVGGLLLRHLQVLQFNAHEISELQLGNKGEGKSVFLGGGLYPTLALFNHSCNPGVTRYFRGTSVVVRTVTTHRRGEMLAENYGPIFTQDPRALRQTTLKEQYHFECVCAPCRQDWPKFEEMNPGLLRFRCDSGDVCSQVLEVAADTDQFMVQCPTCRGYTNILKGLKTLQDTDAMFKVATSLAEKDRVSEALGKFLDILSDTDAMFKVATSLVEKDRVSEALGKFLDILSVLDKTLVPPFRDYHLCQQSVRTCMLKLGNLGTLAGTGT
uniref:SET domain-containing protein n=1 Tax=Timema shepardi TaxID=629360 RepID=A0A7R9BDB1_TIMSH|nr:unnamed protein product [Timema shepardi]